MRETVRAYANGWYRTERTPEDFALAARGAVGKGYTALKFDPFGAAWRRMEPPDVGLSLEIVAAIREAVGGNVELMVKDTGGSVLTRRSRSRAACTLRTRMV